MYTAVIVALWAFTGVGWALTYRRLLHAQLDPGTGLPARAAWRSRALSRMPRATAVVLADADGLKGINDVHGHAAGDIAICAVARALTTSLGDCSRIGRIGGDEFAAVVAAPREILRQRLAALQRALDKPVATPEGVCLTVGASVGVAHTSDLAAWHERRWAAALSEGLAVADAAMYRTKQRRRSPQRVVPRAPLCRAASPTTVQATSSLPLAGER